MTTLILAAFLLTPPNQAALVLPALFSNNMVLQRGIAAPVFGTASPGQSVEVTIAGKKVRTKAGTDGKWLAKLPRLDAGGPYTMTVKADRTVTLENILVGEVWVCSGQSNMQMSVSGTLTAADNVANPEPAVRMFTVQDVSTETPAGDVIGSWQPANAETVGGFSAVGYEFAKELHNKLNVPIGIIHTSWGGTPAEAWTSRDTLHSDPQLSFMVDRYLKALPTFKADQASYEQRLLKWTSTAYPQANDTKAFESGWATPAAEDATWVEIKVPGAIERQIGREFDGAFWCHKTVEIPSSWEGKDVELKLGAVDDYDVTYFNNVEVGRMGAENPNSWQAPRSYKVPKELVRAGQVTIAVRVMDTGGAGGITGQPGDARLICGRESIVLDGTWKMKIEAALVAPSADVLNAKPAEPFGPGNPWVPGGLYNGMIAPLIPYGIRGALWYQGESNADRSYQYRHLFSLMIQDWRKRWGQGNFPFYFVQLANFMATDEQPVESGWAELREAQTMALKLPNTGMAVIIDAGEAADIHPKNKRTVGQRLAFNALAKVYGQKVAYLGPMYKRMTVAGSSIKLFFEGVGTALTTSDGGAIKGFAIAGDDHKFVWANATLSGTTVVVSSLKVPKPVAVRYAWANNPVCNLVNSTGLPASPFRTDDWPGITLNAK